VLELTPLFNKFDIDETQRGIKNSDGDALSAWKHIFVRHGNVAVRENGERRRGRIRIDRSEADLSSDFVARRIVSLREDGRVERVKRKVVLPYDDVTAIRQSGDPFAQLHLVVIRRVDLRLRFPKSGGRGHAVPLSTDVSAGRWFAEGRTQKCRVVEATRSSEHCVL